MKICNDSSFLAENAKPLAVGSLALAVALLALDRFAVQGRPRLSLGLKVGSGVSLLGAGLLLLNPPGTVSDGTKMALIKKVGGQGEDLALTDAEQCRRGVCRLSSTFDQLAQFTEKAVDWRSEETLEAFGHYLEAAIALSYAEQLYSKHFPEDDPADCKQKRNQRAPYIAYSQLRGEWQPGYGGLAKCSQLSLQRYTTDNGGQGERVAAFREQYNEWVAGVSQSWKFPADSEGKPFVLVEREIEPPFFKGVFHIEIDWGSELVGGKLSLVSVRAAYNACLEPVKRMYLALLLSDLAVHASNESRTHQKTNEILDDAKRRYGEAFNMPQTCRDEIDPKGWEVDVCDRVLQGWKDQMRRVPE